LLYKCTLPVLEAMETSALRRMRRVVAQSRHTARMVSELGVPTNRIEVVPVPIDTRATRPIRGLDRRGVLFVGRADDPRKGFSRVLRLAIRSEAVRYTGIDVVSPSARIAVPAQLRSTIRWWGHLPHLGERYASAQLLVLPSLQEGLGIVAFEALAAGTPVVAFTCGGPDDFLRESGGATVVTSLRDFGDAVERLIADPSLRDDMGKHGRAWVLANMSAERFLSDSSIFTV
jgi:glycosyltransferase involved in cell wall biosynthesis